MHMMTAPAVVSLFRAQTNVMEQKRAATQGLARAGPACTVKTTSRQPRLALIASALWLACFAACQPAGPSYSVVDSDSMESEDLFAPVDTVRFDASVLIGMMRFVDVSDQGDFLITDDQSNAFHVFTASGTHVRTFTASQCNPEDSGHLLSARFLEGGRMMATTSSGAYAFNADGSCEKRLLDLPTNRASFCEWRGSVYFLEPSRSTPKIYAYAIESGIVRDYDLRKPKFIGVTSVKRGQVGREIACFDDGVFYRYPESSDGEPLWPGNAPVMHRPTFYRPPQRDMITTDNMAARIDNLMELSREATYSIGIFALDEIHRLVRFERSRSRTPLNIVNTETQTSVSTVTDLRFKLAKHGFLYVPGGYEPLPSGEFGNQMLERWRFTPFEASSDEVAE